MCNYLIREMKLDEIDILKDMLYEAIFQPDETNLLSREVIEQPELRVFLRIGDKLMIYVFLQKLMGKSSVQCGQEY
ncbi:hypothetical protein [Serpentinicella alkaliphila]|uniref:Uncharacterized protein n=1 Tax=Serpentinicella alkaliphila TaxID=1734049 RepID=A0A4R2T091_9FIRM|nr:hypothetical protein EDD79_10735 [Serpentinicella alkaliphila]